MRTATVRYSDGQIITTSINGTNTEIQDYFKLGKWFNLGEGEQDNMQQVESLTIE